MGPEERDRAVAALDNALRWIVRFMERHILTAEAALEIARTIGLDVSAYERDATWRDPSNRAALMHALVADAAANERLMHLMRELRSGVPAEAAALDAQMHDFGHVMEQSARLRPAEQQQQRPEAVWPTSATRGDDHDAQTAPAGDHFETLRLDTAVPARVYLRRAFTLAVAVRQADSPVLMREGLPVTGSGGVDVFWPEGAAFVTLRVRISAPDCTIHGSRGDTFRLLPGRDSPDFLYHLTPKRTGPISIFVTVYQEGERLGTAGVDTTASDIPVAEALPGVAAERSLSAASAQPVGAVTMQVQSHALLSLPVARALRGLHEVLVEYFRDRAVPLVMASQAGLDTAYIRVSDVVADLWWNVLEAAHAEQRVAELVEVAKGRVNRRAGALDTAHAAYAGAA